MKKLNKKGMTLTELIVGFLIVAVAMLYFFQTLKMVQKIYKKAEDQTNKYVDKSFIMRLLDAKENNPSSPITTVQICELADTCEEINEPTELTEDGYKKYTIKFIDETTVDFYKYLAGEGGDVAVTPTPPPAPSTPETPTTCPNGKVIKSDSVPSLSDDFGKVIEKFGGHFKDNNNIEAIDGGKNNFVITASHRNSRHIFKYPYEITDNNHIHIACASDGGGNTNNTTLYFVSENDRRKITHCTNHLGYWGNNTNIDDYDIRRFRKEAKLKPDDKIFLEIVVTHSDVDCFTSYTHVDIIELNKN